LYVFHMGIIAVWNLLLFSHQSLPGSPDEKSKRMSVFAPTAYPDVNLLLAELLAAARQALGEQLIGLYLYGSLAIGGFKPGRSDIDFLAVTAAELSPAELAALQGMHRRLAAGPSPWAGELEGSYIPAAALRRYDPRRTLHPHIDRGSNELRIEQHDTDWVSSAG
jgi:hypothetical protein